jgi:hypothetical protein
MKYIITEEQFEFLNYAVKPRSDKMEDFGYEVQKVIDDNLESILSESNLEGYDPITDLFIYDIKLGYGNRIYDLVIRAVVDEKPDGKYFANDWILKFIIIDLIKKKFGIKCGVEVELTTLY